MNIILIGYGNELRGDDGLGPCIARTIADRAAPQVRTLVVHQLTPELADDVAGADLVILVDACFPGDAGKVRMQKVECATASGLAHTSEPRGLLGLCRALYRHTPQAWLVTVAGDDFSLGDGLSTSAQANAAVAVKEIEALIEKHLAAISVT